MGSRARGGIEDGYAHIPSGQKTGADRRTFSVGSIHSRSFVSFAPTIIDGVDTSVWAHHGLLSIWKKQLKEPPRYHILLSLLLLQSPFHFFP